MQDDFQTGDQPSSNYDRLDDAHTPQKQPIFNVPNVLITIIGLCFTMHILREYILSPRWQEWVLINLAYFPVRYTPNFFALDLPTLISPVSHTLLHGDWAHLGMNMVWLVAFGAPVAYRLGWIRSLLFWVVTSLGAVILHTIIYFGDPIPLIGASGAVSGFLGGAARFGFRSNRTNPRAGLAGPLYSPLMSLRQRGVLPFLAIWMVINFAFGSDVLGLSGGATIAWEAHIGGLVTGFFAIALLDPYRQR